MDEQPAYDGPCAFTRTIFYFQFFPPLASEKVIGETVYIKPGPLQRLEAHPMRQVWVEPLGDSHNLGDLDELGKLSEPGDTAYWDMEREQMCPEGTAGRELAVQAFPTML